MALQKLLIANRGEIACRIIKTAKRMGITTVAIYSDPDCNARHVKLSDEAYHLPGLTSQETYLNISKIIEIAQRCGAQAIHPGYGFLSENTEFAKTCEQHKIIFVGPPVKAIELMGDKRAAKEHMQHANVPTTPGYNDKIQDDQQLLKAAKTIGFPVLIKASAGGGGKGMRLVHQENEFIEELAAARREAKSSFNNDELILEKYFADARHVEMQIFCDQQGNAVHLWNRDCSIQRRHQKIIEEAPAPNLPTTLTDAMAQAAIDAAKSINYVGAGTIEFLVANDQFYFMEMNTRLQVEHPVTEMITGVDLVEWQLRIATGESLPLSQKQITPHGHAIEARIYAEDPHREFCPAVGKLIKLQFPSGEHTRIDTGVNQGDTISVFYDPMIAKLIVWAEDRQAAIQALCHALAATMIIGVTTNVEFLSRICRSENFITAKLNTHFVNDHRESLLTVPNVDDTVLTIAAHIQYHLQLRAGKIRAAQSTDKNSPWFIYDNWQAQHKTLTTIKLWQAEKMTCIDIHPGQVPTKFSDHMAEFIVNNYHVTVYFCQRQDILYLFIDGEHYQFHTYPPHQQVQADLDAAHLTSPMPGTTIAVMVSSGQHVKKGERLMVIEAMKMEHTIRAPADGTIGDIHFKAGELVNEGVELLQFTPDYLTDETT